MHKAVDAAAASRQQVAAWRLQKLALMLMACFEQAVVPALASLWASCLARPQRCCLLEIMLQLGTSQLH